MPSTDYSRGYNKGFSTGGKRSDDARDAAEARAKQAAERAERAEKQQGLGHCEHCAYWLRGGGGLGADACAWGTCEAPRAAGRPWGTWASPHTGRQPDHKIQTTPRFGCVVFMASNVADNRHRQASG